MFRLSDRVVRSEKSAWEAAPADCYVLDLGSGRYWSVGEVGGFIWERLDGRELASVAAAVGREFEVEPERAAADLLEFVERLAELGLAHRDPA